MARIRFTDKQIADIVMTLIGEVQPVGETYIDDKRCNSLMRLLNTTDLLLDEIYKVVPFVDASEYSVQTIRVQAVAWLAEKQDWINDLYEVQEWKKRINGENSTQPEIIRCKDCKHYDTSGCMGRDAFYSLKDDDFCSWGERQE